MSSAPLAHRTSQQPSAERQLSSTPRGGNRSVVGAPRRSQARPARALLPARTPARTKAASACSRRIRQASISPSSRSRSSARERSRSPRTGSRGLFQRPTARACARPARAARPRHRRVQRQAGVAPLRRCDCPPRARWRAALARQRSCKLRPAGSASPRRPPRATARGGTRCVRRWWKHASLKCLSDVLDGRRRASSSSSIGSIAGRDCGELDQLASIVRSG